MDINTNNTNAINTNVKATNNTNTTNANTDTRTDTKTDTKTTSANATKSSMVDKAFDSIITLGDIAKGAKKLVQWQTDKVKELVERPKKYLGELEKVIELKNSPRYSYHYGDALKAGLSASDIVEHLKTIDEGYNFDKAKKAGLSDEDIVNYFINKKKELNQQEKDISLNYTLSQFGMDNDYVKGIVRGLVGINAIEQDIAHALGFKDDEEWKKSVNQIVDLTKTLEHSRENKDIISPYNLGQLTLDLASPVAKSKLLTAGIASALGYGYNRAEGKDIKDSAISGALAGTVTLGAMYTIDKLLSAFGEKATKDVYEYYKSQLNYDDEVADKVYKKWIEVNESTGKEMHDRVLSILDHAGDSGAALKSALARMSPKYYKALESARIARINDLNKMSHVDVTLSDVAKQLEKSIQTAHNNYTRIKWQIDKAYVPQGVEKDILPFKLPDTIIDEIDKIKPIKSQLKTLLEEEPIHPTNLIEAMPLVNHIIRNSSGKIQHAWQNVRQQLDDSLQALLHPHDYRLWRQASNEYKLATDVADSKIGDAILRTLKKRGKRPQIEPTRALEIIQANKDAGRELFSNIKYLVGDKSAQDFEKLIINSFIDKHPDDITWSTIAKNLSTKGFVTPEGKELQKTLQLVSDVFKTDDAIRALYRPGTFEGSGISSDLRERALVYATSRIFKQILKYLPTDAAKDYRMLEKLGKISLTVPKLKKIQKVVEHINPGLKDKIWEIVGKELPPSLEHFDAKKKANVTNKIYNNEGVSEVVNITPEMQRNIDIANLGNYMLSYIREHAINDVVGGRVVEEAGRYLDKVNYFRELDKFNHTINVNNRKRAAKRLQAIIDHHTNKIIKRLKDNFDIEIPRDVVKDIVEYITKKYGKDC